HGHRPVTLAARLFARGYPSAIPGSPCWQHWVAGSAAGIVGCATLGRRLRDPVSPGQSPRVAGSKTLAAESERLGRGFATLALRFGDTGSLSRTYWVAECAAQYVWVAPPGCQLGDPVSPGQRPGIADPETEGGEAVTQSLRLGSQGSSSRHPRGIDKANQGRAPGDTRGRPGESRGANTETQGSRTDTSRQALANSMPSSTATRRPGIARCGSPNAYL